MESTEPGGREGGIRIIEDTKTIIEDTITIIEDMIIEDTICQ